MKHSRLIILLIVLIVSAVLVFRSCGTQLTSSTADVTAGESGTDAADPSSVESTSSGGTSSKSTPSGAASSKSTSQENAPMSGDESAHTADNANPGRNNAPEDIGTGSPDRDDMDARDEDGSPVVENYIVEIREDEGFEIG